MTNTWIVDQARPRLGVECPGHIISATETLMKSHPRISAGNSWLYRLFSPGPVRVSLTDGEIYFDERHGEAQIPLGEIGSITVSPSWFWHRLTVRLSDGTERSIGGLDGEEAHLIRAAVKRETARIHEAALREAARIREAAEAEAARLHEAAVAEAKKRAKALNPRLARLDEDLRQLLAGERYARYQHSLKLHEAIASILEECGGLIREHLEPEARETLGQLEPLKPVERFEAARRLYNCNFVSSQVSSAQHAAREELPNPLTREQAEAVATDEDATLVLAGAGTGKTSVIVGKVAYLVHDQGLAPNDILVLAFNRPAAGEIRGRLTGNLSKANVSTFHSFGRRVIKEVEGRGPNIAAYARGPKLLRTLEDILEELLDDPRHSDATADFIASYHGIYKPVSEFGTEQAYAAYVRSVELRTLSGDKVKSFEELEIANYLTKHGVNFCYERPYKFTRQQVRYRPDFYLPDYDIYIEHHALNERGNPPPGWKGYKERVNWHRRTHKRYGTKLIETFSWQSRRGTLLNKLRARLEAEGVRFEPISLKAKIKKIFQQLVRWLVNLLAKFLNHVKTSNLPPGELRSRASKHGALWRDLGFLEVFEQVRTRYEQRLRAEGKLDFHDLINRAARYIREGKWKTPYRYVLVDEFQDISAGRMKLLQALRREGTAYFLVGDDWQSINRFAGSDVGLLRNCGEYLGHVQTKTLSRTFRFGKDILGPSTEFVRRNREQTQRSLTSESAAGDRGITVIWADDVAGFRRAREDIHTSAIGNGHSVLALGRYNFTKDGLQLKAPSEEFSTVHSAKGSEADYVVVLDLKDGRWGFPSRIEDSSLLELVLPPTAGKPYPFAEERRLFYVAMTRARIGAYLVTDPARPSMFVTELLEFDDLRQIDTQVARPGEGYCIRCRTILPANPNRPYCRGCYSSWYQYRDASQEERYCHTCGLWHAASLFKPLCASCQPT